MEDSLDDGLTAVVAHGLLNSVAVVTGNLALVLSDAPMSEEKRVDLLRRAHDHARFIGGVLGDLMRGLPPAVLDVLGAAHEP